MELCYEGGLVMPSSYVMMNEEEMTYVEGGFYLNRDTCVTVSTYIHMFTGVSQFVLAGLAIGELACRIARVSSPLIGAISGINPILGGVAAILGIVALVQLATFCNGVLGASSVGTGVSMDWVGVFCHKKYH